MKDVSIIIPSRGASIGTWATLHSCYEDVKDSGFSFEFIIVANGEPKANELQTLQYYVEKHSLGKIVYYPDALTPPVARQRGVTESDGKYSFFFDNHCLVAKDYFRRAIDTLENGADLVHSATQFYAEDYTNYQYRLKLDYNFWGVSEVVPEDHYRPYKIAAGGHGGFAIHRDVWDAIGGYGPEDLFAGYGGEELLLDLKLWRYGYTNWLNPKVLHYHFCGIRGYQRHYSDEYYTNMMTSAYIIGGSPWLYKVYNSFAGDKSHVRINPVLPMFDLLQIAESRGRDYSKYVDAHSKYSLDELLALFRQTLVAM